MFDRRSVGHLPVLEIKREPGTVIASRAPLSTSRRSAREPRDLPSRQSRCIDDDVDTAEGGHDLPVHTYKEVVSSCSIKGRSSFETAMVSWCKTFVLGLLLGTPFAAATYSGNACTLAPLGEGQDDTDQVC